MLGQPDLHRKQRVPGNQLGLHNEIKSKKKERKKTECLFSMHEVLAMAP